MAYLVFAPDGGEIEVDLATDAGPDFVFIDTEHIALDNAREAVMSTK